MKRLINLTSSLANRINGLVSQAEHAHPGMREVAAMIYVGDVYALREQSELSQDDVWGNTSGTSKPL